jgi:hypothetical protein
MERTIPANGQAILLRGQVAYSVKTHGGSVAWLKSRTTVHDRNLVSVLLLKPSQFIAFSHCLRLK